MKGPVQAKKHLGQHFLTDLDTAKRIAQTLTLKDTHRVLEIGPGTGVLTQFLLEQPIDLVALDIDRESIDYLNQQWAPVQAQLMHPGAKLRVVYGDFLKADIQDWFGGQPFNITGNFPYNISTKIVFKLLAFRDQIPEFSGMFQKEVAQRICAGPGSKVYGILSVLTQAFYEATYLFTVPPGVFSPPPKVDSGVLLLQRRTSTDLGCDEKRFFLVVKTAFNQRRKTLRNSLKGCFPDGFLPKDAIFDQRPEQLGVAEFVALTQLLDHGHI